jgi:hypothetical protein
MPEDLNDSISGAFGNFDAMLHLNCTPVFPHN